MSDTAEILEQAARWREAGKGVALATVVSTWGSSPRPLGSKLAVDSEGAFIGSVSGGCVEGAVHIAQPLVQMLSLADYQPIVIDPRQSFATEARFPGLELSTEWPDEALERLRPDHRSAVVTLTHDPKLDDPALAVALRSECFYIGALGSKRTHAARYQRLTEMGFTDADLARIHGPIGLSIGAVSPAEIAVSILGQMTQG